MPCLPCSIAQGLTLNVAHNAYAHNESIYGTGQQWRDWKDAQFLSANVVSILTGLLTTLDGIVEVCGAGSRRVFGGWEPAAAVAAGQKAWA